MKIIRLIPLASLLVLIGCGSSDEPTTSDAGQDTEENTESYTVEHSLGVAEFEEPPEKVVTLFQGANDTAAALGYEPVGIVESWLEPPVYEYLREDLGESTVVGDEIQPNLEEIAALEPDVIIATQSRHEDIDELNDFKMTLDVMGETLAVEDEAEALLSRWDERVDHFKSEMEQIEEEPLTRSVINFRSDSLRLFVGGFPGSVLEDAGFEIPENQQEAYDADEAFIELTNTESIPELNSDQFFIYLQSNQDSDELDESWDLWTEHPLWEELDAVENDQVEMVDEVTWSMGAGYIAANHMLDDLYDIYGIEKE